MPLISPETSSSSSRDGDVLIMSSSGTIYRHNGLQGEPEPVVSEVHLRIEADASGDCPDHLGGPDCQRQNYRARPLCADDYRPDVFWLR